jgi:outer membrane protein assembly factor BamA
VLLAVFVIAAAGSAIVYRALPSQEAVAAAPRTIPAQQIQSVSIDAVDGTSGLPMLALRGRLGTHVGAMLDAGTLERDRVGLERELADRGYLAARVAPAHVDFAAQGGAYVVFDIERGPMFHLRKVTVTGPGSREVGVVTLSPGDEVVVERIAHARQALVDTLARRGGVAPVTVELAQQLDIAAAAVDLTLVTK